MYGDIKFFSLNKASDWEKGWAANCQTDSRGISLHSSEQYAVSRLLRSGEMLGEAAISDFAVARPGLVLVLDEYAGLWSFDINSDYRHRVFAGGHGMFTPYAALTAHEDIVYAADIYGEHRFSAFSLGNGQRLFTIDRFEGIDMFPAAAAAGRDGNLYAVVVIDQPAEDGGRLVFPAGARMAVVRINQSGQVTAAFRDENLQLPAPVEARQLRNSIYIAANVKGWVSVLDASSRMVWEFDSRGALRRRHSLGEEIEPAGIALDPDGKTYIGDCRRSGPEAQEDRFVMQLCGDKVERVPGFHGRADKVLLDQRNNLYILNGEASFITILEPQPKITPLEYTGLPQGFYFSAALDCGAGETRWHKIEMDADIPEDTQIRFFGFAVDSLEKVIDGKLTNLNDFLAGDVEPLEKRLNYFQSLGLKPMINPRDALLNAQGRYLFFLVELIGSERRTPELKRLRVYYPRASYLNYLPAVYSHDEESRDFLERFLSLFATFFTGMEEQIANIARNFEPEVASGDFLRWLASWLAVAVDDNLSENQIRELMLSAPELYQCRGTRRGIERMVEIYTGEKPLIVENYQVRAQRQNPEMKELVNRLFPDDPYCFSVMVRRECVPDDHRYLMVQRMVNQEKPAFTEVRLVVLQPWIYMDMHTYLGVNTYLSELTLLRLDQLTAIPNDAVLIDVDQDNRIEAHTRIELDAELR